jgi:poly-gamma-glutamate synthesis protein (capsule biosynthesis protein)
VHLLAVGDVLLDRGVADAIAAHGMDSLLAVVAPQLQAAHLAFANLECPISAVGPHSAENAIFRADPATIAVLQQGGFDVVSLANNHTLNAGLEGLIETIGHLESAGIGYVGGARDPAHGSDPLFVTVQGQRLGFLAFTHLDFYHESQSQVDGDLSNLRQAVAAARPNCELLCVSIHWGVQHSQTATQEQARVAHAAIDAGADLILGHHPHVLQGIGIYRQRLILYSMGNFVFDKQDKRQDRSAIFDLYYTPGVGLRLWVTPVRIPAARCGPEYAAGGANASILDELARLSDPLGVTLTQAGGVGSVDCSF